MVVSVKTVVVPVARVMHIDCIKEIRSVVTVLVFSQMTCRT